MADVKTLRVTVITPARAAYSATARSVVVPAFDGEMGVLPGHAAMLALLGTGEMRVGISEEETQRLAIRGGFLQVRDNQVSVLTPEALTPGELAGDALEEELRKLEAEEPVTLADREARDMRRAWIKARQRVLGDSAGEHG
ncbi:MAG: ATP synthase F1 subunit epsilon [Planctomycetota bacterium]|nr:ATP synthase F1 subunit epsilon [Planctomycetota bacterium]